ncbi:hypothetical protein FCU56_22280 [Vibrio vulnificus]|nr:hypothetical protein [Vibrio vulnificus]
MRPHTRNLVPRLVASLQFTALIVLNDDIATLGAKMSIPMIVFIMVPIIILIIAPGIMRMLTDG